MLVMVGEPLTWFLNFIRLSRLNAQARSSCKEARMDAGHLIATQVTLLYFVLSPLVLLAIYVLFDALSKPGADADLQKTADGKDPALWTNEDINTHMHRI